MLLMKTKDKKFSYSMFYIFVGTMFYIFLFSLLCTGCKWSSTKWQSWKR